MTYRELIEWFGSGDPTTKRMLEQILQYEEDYAVDLSDLIICKKITYKSEKR
jgi:bacterioferritin